jgi:tetratricopeptide (TPR) repeat protein
VWVWKSDNNDLLSEIKIQQLTESIQQAEDANKIFDLVLIFDDQLDAYALDDLLRIDFLLTIGEVLYKKGNYKDAGRLLELGLAQARKEQYNGKQAIALGLLTDLDLVQGNYRNTLSRLLSAREILGENPDSDKDISARLLPWLLAHPLVFWRSFLNLVFVGEWRMNEANGSHNKFCHFIFFPYCSYSKKS